MVHSCTAMIGPSVLACDLSNLATESQRVLAAGADFLHLDVMDGNFVPNLSFGAPVIKCLNPHVAGAILDVHLMVTTPMMWVKDMADAGATAFTFHIESSGDPRAIIESVKSHAMKVGIALKPSTGIEVLEPYLKDIDQVLVMTVEPGFGGQSFMADMMEKVSTLRTLYPTLDIMVDGGISPSTIDQVATAGANMIVAGTSVFKSPDAAAAIAQLRRSIVVLGNGIEE